MNDTDLILAQSDKLQFVAVQFTGSTTLYTYKTTLQVQEGDYVVVLTPSGGLQVATVHGLVDMHDVTYEGYIKWIVTVLDMNHYTECLEAEREVTATLAKAKRHKLVKEASAALSESLGLDPKELIKRL